jgi:hypothetical protein
MSYLKGAPSFNLKNLFKSFKFKSDRTLAK